MELLVPEPGSQTKHVLNLDLAFVFLTYQIFVGLPGKKNGVISFLICPEHRILVSSPTKCLLMMKNEHHEKQQHVLTLTDGDSRVTSVHTCSWALLDIMQHNPFSLRCRVSQSKFHRFTFLMDEFVTWMVRSFCLCSDNATVAVRGETDLSLVAELCESLCVISALQQNMQKQAQNNTTPACFHPVLTDKSWLRVRLVSALKL